MPEATLVLALLAAVAASMLAGNSVDYSLAGPPPPLQPKDAAFGLAWGVLFPALALGSLVAGEEDVYPPRAVLCVVASLALTCVWAGTVTHLSKTAAAVALALSAAAAWGGLALLPLAASPQTLLVAPGLGFYAGWLTVATWIGLSTASLPSVATRPRTTLLAGTLVVGLASIALAQPTPPLAVALAAAMQRPHADTPLLLANLGLALVAGGARGARQ